MRLRAWRESWMWLAITACGGSTPTWMTRTGPARVSIYDAVPLAGATYVATVEPGDRRGRGSAAPAVVAASSRGS